MINAIAKKIADDYGQNKADAVKEQAEIRLKTIREENSDDPKVMKSHTDRIYPGIAVYEAMRSFAIEEDQAVDYIRQYFYDICDKVVPVLRAAFKVPGVYKKVPELFIKIARDSFSEEAGFVYEWPELPEDTYGFDIVKCPYFNICTKYGCPEIVPAFCDSDDRSYGNMHDNLIWERTETIGRGCDRCNYRIRVKK